MNKQKNAQVSSVQAEEDAQGNSCEQSVQPSVEPNACAASAHSITPGNAVVSASDNLNSGTDCATTNPYIVMNLNNNTNTAVAPASEGVSYISTFSFAASESPIGFNRAAYTAPAAPGNEWDTVYSGTCVDLADQGGVENELVLAGDTLTLSHPTQLAVYLRADDIGTLLISSSILSEEEVKQRVLACAANPDSLNAGDIIFQYNVQDKTERWQDADLGADSWKMLTNELTLPAGTYHIYGLVTNIGFSSGNNINNRKLFRYAICAKRVVVNGEGQPVEVPYHGDVRQVCQSCGCGSTDDGDADNQAASQAPGWEGDACPGFVKLNPANGKALYDSPWRWKAAIVGSQVVITPPVGEALLFEIPAEDDSEAGTTGASGMAFNRIQYQDADFNATTSRTPAFIMMKDPTGLCLTFMVSTGEVFSITTPEGRKVTATERAQHVQTQFDGAGNLLSCASAEGLLVCSTDETGALRLDWFAPAATAAVDDEAVAAAPFKSETIQQNSDSTTITRQQTGRDPHSVVRSESNGVVTITRGEGNEAIVHRYETTYPVSGLMVRTESVYYAAAPDNVASCTRSVYNYSAAGWQLYSMTEGFGSATTRTISYRYNTDNKLVKVEHSDGSYAEYEYDSLGRVTMEKSPWGENLAKVTRTTYADSRFYDVRPASVAEYHVNASGAEVLFRSTAYSYEESAGLERVTTTVTAGGSSQQQVSIAENFGAEPAYAYAAGKPKFSQGIDGVQSWHEYEATAEHGAIHKHTTITRANGELVAAQSRRSERFIAANDTTTFEQESIWDGSQWLLLNTTAYEYDEQLRVVKTMRGNGRFSTTEWMCCGRLSETDEDGITTTYAYDSARQLTEISREAVYDGEVCISPETITEYTRDAAGRTLCTIRRTGPMTTTESTAYDALGRVASQTDILGRVTNTAYSMNGRTTTRTTPSGATFVSELNPDGSTARTAGTGQREQLYVYDLSGNNERVTTKLPGGEIIAQSISNGFGQTAVQAQPNTLGGFIYSRSEYNAKGYLTKQYQDTGWNTEKTAPTLYEYDSFGNQVKQTLALSTTPTKDNSPVSEVAYSVESMDDGIYSATTQTRYNAEGQPLNTTQKELISQLSPAIESKSVFISERGLTSTQWTEYSEHTKRVQYSTAPTSSITAETVTVDGFTLSQKDTAGVITSFTRSYTVNGMVLTQTDGRGNTTTTVADKAGRALMVTDAAGNVTTTVYCDCCDQPATITDAQGNTTCYRYDERGRKVAEWGTAVQPATFGYDDAGNMVALTTYRGAPATNADGSPVQSGEGAAAGDVTTWTYDPATGLELRKTYADQTSVSKSYDAYNHLATETNARGKVKMHTYEHARGLLLGTTYYHAPQEGEEPVQDSFTPARSYAYNHLAQLTQVTDAAGTRTLGYNQYGEQESDSLVVDGDTHLITEPRDAQGRSTGYVYSKNGATQQPVTTGYGADGRIATAGFVHGGEEKQFSYEYLPGTHLLQKLIKPNGMSLTQSYETQRDLLTGMAYHRGSTLVAQRTYTYDTLGRPLSRSTARNGQTVNDSFGYNNRSELTTATVNGGSYAYDYDNIGNRKAAQEAAEEVTDYQSNELNQYTALSVDGVIDFQPEYDADGNQTRVKTSTGIWAVSYDTENRPTEFTSVAADNTITTVHCEYDSMGRRAIKRVMVNGNVTLHQRYIYRGYLQIACIDLTRSHHPALWYITWDPTQNTATRPLALQKDGTWYTYGWDLTKNICEVYSSSGYIRTNYAYSPYGLPSQSTNGAAAGGITQPIQWSSEYNDTELGLTYYNYRHYNPVDGRWMGRDPLSVEDGWNLYSFVVNMPILSCDILGLKLIEKSMPYEGRPRPNEIKGYTELKDATFVGKPLKIEYLCERKNNKFRIYVKDVEEPTFVVHKYWPSKNQKIRGYARSGVLAIIGHEQRRLLVYKKADETYIKLVINNVKVLYSEDTWRRLAEDMLDDYIQDYYNTAKTCFIRYVKEEQKLISSETYSNNFILGANLDIIGINHIHIVSEPYPAPMEKLPEGLGRV